MLASICSLSLATLALCFAFKLMLRRQPAHRQLIDSRTCADPVASSERIPTRRDGLPRKKARGPEHERLAGDEQIELEGSGVGEEAGKDSECVAQHVMFDL